MAWPRSSSEQAYGIHVALFRSQLCEPEFQIAANSHAIQFNRKCSSSSTIRSAKLQMRVAPDIRWASEHGTSLSVDSLPPSRLSQYPFSDADLIAFGCDRSVKA